MDETMKLRVSIPILILCASSVSHAQLVRSYGVKLGAVSANQTWHYTFASDLASDGTTNYRWGITGGVYVELLDIPLLSLVAELQYTQKGTRYPLPLTSVSQPDGTGQFKTLSPRVDYLSVPILAKLRLKLPFFTPYIISGPRADLLVSKRGEGFDLVIGEFKSTDVGGTIGVGVEIHTLLPVGLLAELRYNPSFRDSYKDKFLTVRNRSFDFLVGLQL
jgi:hypothetical protein